MNILNTKLGSLQRIIWCAIPGWVINLFFQIKYFFYRPKWWIWTQHKYYKWKNPDYKVIPGGYWIRDFDPNDMHRYTGWIDLLHACDQKDINPTRYQHLSKRKVQLRERMNEHRQEFVKARIKCDSGSEFIYLCILIKERQKVEELTKEIRTAIDDLKKELE